MTQVKGFNWLNVLLVDDSVSILDYVAHTLKQHFNIPNVFTASSALEALQVLRQTENINLLFIDLNMPHTDGIQLLEQISFLGFKGYVVIMSGVANRVITSAEILSKQYGLNYIGTLIKPLHESGFITIIEKIGKSRTKLSKVESLKIYEIIRAINNDDFQVYYQPQVSLASRRVLGVEALCRMKHPRLGLVSPDRFIDKAEESDLIIHITLSVLKKALADWQKWHKHGVTLKLSVNTSPIALQQPEFADIVFNLLAQFNMPAECLCFEVTENVLAENQTQELMNLSRLHMRGVGIALDDFGKEYSTIERLRKLPLTYLKLDKNYFLENRDNISQLSLINTSLALADELKICTIAEGIEDAEILALATQTGCDYGQGYYIATPMSAPKILTWLHEWQAKT